MNTIRREMALVMFAALAVGSVAWAGEHSENVSGGTSPWAQATVDNTFTGPGTRTEASSMGVFANPNSGDATIGTITFTGEGPATGYFYAGARSDGQTLGPDSDVDVTVGSIYFNGSNGVFVVDPNASVAVENGVNVSGAGNIVRHRGGDLTFEKGVTIQRGGRVETNSGSAIDAEISVGKGTQIGDVVMQGGGAVIDGYGLNGSGSLTFLDETSGNSDFEVLGDGNSIVGTVDFGDLSKNYDYMDMRVTYDSTADRKRNDTTGYYDGLTTIGDANGTTTVTVGDYFQDTGIVTGYAGRDTLAVIGDSFNVLGGGFSVSTNTDTDMYFNGDRWNSTSLAELVGDNQTIESADLINGNRIFIGENAALNLSFGGLTTDGMKINIDEQGDIVFGVGNNNALKLENGSGVTAANPGSVKFSEAFLKTDHPANVALAVSDSNSITLGDVYFDGLFGTFAAETSLDGRTYSLTDYTRGGINFDGSTADFENANRKLREMYGKTTSQSFNEVIYRSVSNANTGYFSRLQPAVNATDAQFDSYYLNQANLLGFASGRDEYRDIQNLYLGNTMSSANMISQAVARTHIDASMRRSDQLRQALNRVCIDECGQKIVYNVARAGMPNTIWASGFGLWESANTRHGHAGYKYKSGGFILGYDRIFGDNLIIGGSFAFNKGDFEDKAAIRHDSTIKNYSGNIYATYNHYSGFFGTLFAGYTYSKNDLRETYVSDGNNPLKSNQRNHTKTWSTGIRLGYDIRPNENFTITPSVGFTYINARSSAHNLYLGDTLQGRHGRMKDHAAYVPIEVNASYDIKFANDAKLNLNGKVGYAYNFNKSGAHGYLDLAGYDFEPTYRSATRDQGRHTFRAGAGMTYSNRRWDLGVNYDYFRQAKSNNHRVMATVGFNF